MRFLSGAAPLSADCAGRAILAHLGKVEIGRHLAWLSARGVKLPAGLERELAAIRARGFAHGSNGRESGLAFPIRKLDQAFASVAIEGSGYAAAAKAAPIPEWEEIARAIEAVVRANPALGNQPFRHIDPDVIVLPS